MLASGQSAIVVPKNAPLKAERVRSGPPPRACTQLRPRNDLSSARTGRRYAIRGGTDDPGGCRPRVYAVQRYFFVC